MLVPYAAAAAGAVLLWMAFPPVGWGLLAFVAPAPFLWAIRQCERGTTALAVGFTFGAVFFGTMLWWIFILGAVAWIPLTLVMAAFASVYALGVWSFRLWPPGRWWMIAVGGWGLWEWVRAHFPFGGFPWGSVGYAAGGNPGAIGSVQWIGPAGWSILAVGVAAGIVLLVEQVENWRYVVDTGAVVLLLAMGGALLAPQAEGTEMDVAIIQGGSPCPMTRCQNENKRIFERHIELTRSLPAGSVDLVVWPENSTGTPYEPEGNEEVRAAIAAEAQRLDAYVLISGTRRSGENGFVNVNIVYSPAGRKIGEYAKRHPVPFGEYVPFRGLLSFIPQLERVPRDMVRGSEPVVFRLDQGILGSVISFEGAFVRSIRSEAVRGAEMIVVATNESSYGDDAPASDQLIGMTRVNAAAVGLDLVHAAITGKSTFITAGGEVGDTIELGDTGVLIDTVRFRDAGKTLYTLLGDWALYAALAGLALALLLPGGRPEPASARNEANRTLERTPG
jgi:apolipoprotein N-acyltransferase